MITDQQQRVDQTRAHIRQMVQEIAAITREGPPPLEYFNQFLQRIISALDAQGGAMWLMTGKDAQLVSQIRIVDTEFESNQEQRADIIKALKDVLQNRRPMVVMPQPETAPEPAEAGEEPPPIINRTPYPFFYIPLIVENNCIGVLHVWQKPNRDPSTIPDLIKFLQSVAAYAENYLHLRRLEDLAKESQRLNRLINLAGSLTGQLDTQKIAELISNHGRDAVNCDRLAVLLRKPLNPIRERTRPPRMRVASVSGSATVDAKSVLVKAVVGLCEATVAGMNGPSPAPAAAKPGDPNKPAPDLSRLFLRGGAGADAPGASTYFTESNLNAAIVAPIRTPAGDVVGAVVAESANTQQLEPGRKALEWVAKLAGQTLEGAINYQTLPLRPVMERVQKMQRKAFGPKKARFWTTVITPIVVLMGICIMPIPFKIDGECIVLPTERGTAVFEMNGRIAEVKVDEGDIVKKGDVLTTLDDREVRHELEVTQHDALRYQAEAEKYRAGEDEAQSKIAGINAARAQRQVDLLKYQLEKTVLRSPIDGTVVSRELKQHIGEVVQIGTPFCELINRNDWELNVQVPESDISYVDHEVRKGKKLRVPFILHSHTPLKFEAFVSDPHQLGQTATPSAREAANVFVVRADIASNAESLKLMKPGFTGRATIVIGNRTAAFVTFRRFLNWVRVHLFI